MIEKGRLQVLNIFHHGNILGTLSQVGNKLFKQLYFKAQIYYPLVGYISLVSIAYISCLHVCLDVLFPREYTFYLSVDDRHQQCMLLFLICDHPISYGFYFQGRSWSALFVPFSTWTQVITFFKSCCKESVSLSLQHAFTITLVKRSCIQMHLLSHYGDQPSYQNL